MSRSLPSKIKCMIISQYIFLNSLREIKFRSFFGGRAMPCGLLHRLCLLLRVGKEKQSEEGETEPGDGDLGGGDLGDGALEMETGRQRTPVSSFRFNNP